LFIPVLQVGKPRCSEIKRLTHSSIVRAKSNWSRDSWLLVLKGSWLWSSLLGLSSAVQLHFAHRRSHRSRRGTRSPVPGKVELPLQKFWLLAAEPFPEKKSCHQDFWEGPPSVTYQRWWWPRLYLSQEDCGSSQGQPPPYYIAILRV
jgi:hypothetical protein